MAMNPRWCASLDEWRAAFATWIDRGDPKSLLAANIFFDFRALWGEPRLADALRADVAMRARANPRFLKQMSDNARENRPPLSWRGELDAVDGGSDGEAIDLKRSGSVPFVDAARIFALATGITATNTVDRLTQAGAARGIPEAEVRAWCDAFEFIQLLRLREQHRRLAGDRHGQRRQPQHDAASHVVGARTPHSEGGDAADPQSAAAPRSRLSRMSATFASLRRWLGADARRRRTATLGRRRHGDFGPFPERDRLLAIGAVAVEDGGIRARGQLRSHRTSEPSGDAENIVVHGIGYGAQTAGTPARDALAAFAHGPRDAPRVGFHADFDGTVLRVRLCRRRPPRRRPAVARPRAARRWPRADARAMAVSVSMTGWRPSASNARPPQRGLRRARRRGAPAAAAPHRGEAARRRIQRTRSGRARTEMAGERALSATSRHSHGSQCKVAERDQGNGKSR